MQYQLFPDLNDSEYAELKADIAERGVMVPIEYDEQGNLLDGHHRKRICDELGIKDFPSVTRYGMTEQEKRQHVRKLNLARRHLTKEQRNQIIKDMRADGMSTYQIADETGIPQSTVSRVTANPNGLPDDTPATVTGKDGKTYPATKPRQTPSIIAHDNRQRQKTFTPEVAKAAEDGARSLEQAAKKAKASKDRGNKTAALKSAEAMDEIRAGDFREVLADVESIDAIITDPPYGKDAIPLWRDMGKFAAERLTDSGVLIGYSGQMYLPQVLEVLSESLDYWWTMCVVHKGNGNLTPLGAPVRKVINQWKPLVFFVKRGCGFPETFRDRVPESSPEKDKHNWAQPFAEAVWLVENFTEPGALVVDPFSGSGTVGRAAKETGRYFLGAEILLDG